MSITLNTWELLSSAVLLILSIAALLKYVFYLLDTHRKHVNSRFVNIEKKLTQHDETIKMGFDLLHSTREEMGSKYVRLSRLDAEFKTVTDSFDKVFRYLNGLSKALNQLIGSHNNKIDNQ